MAIKEELHRAYIDDVVRFMNGLLTSKERKRVFTQGSLTSHWEELLRADPNIFLMKLKTAYDLDDFAFFNLMLAISLEVSYRTQELFKKVYATSYATFYLALEVYQDIQRLSFQDAMVIQDAHWELFYASDSKKEGYQYERLLLLQPWILPYCYYGGVMRDRYTSFVYTTNETHLSSEDCSSFLLYAKQGMKAILTRDDELQLLRVLNGMEMTVCAIELAHVPTRWNVHTLFSFISFYAQLVHCAFFIRYNEEAQKEYLKTMIKEFPFTFLITSETLALNDIPVLRMPYSIDSQGSLSKNAFVKEYTFQKELPYFIGDETFLGRLEEFMSMVKHKGEIHQLISSDTATKGISALFYGPSGNGKTLSARYIAKKLEKRLWQIELSNVLDKYIGESEKHLEAIFQDAEKEEVILLFDEADTLFTKRTNVQDANDRYANAITSYLLQRMESFPGIMILTSNFLHNFDDAFLRRIHCILRFSEANYEQRLNKWLTITEHIEVEETVNWDEIASMKLSYARIDQCLFMACSFMVSQSCDCLCEHHIKKAIVYELEKHGELPPKGWLNL